MIYYLEENKGKYSEAELDKQHKIYKELGVTPLIGMDVNSFYLRQQAEQQQIDNLKRLNTFNPVLGVYTRR